MVLPPSAPDDAPAPADRALHERLRLILRLGEAGVLVLVDEARPERSLDLPSAGVPSQGNLAGAREALERAIPMLERIHGTARHPDAAVMGATLGSVLLALGETERGIALHRRAHETLRVQLGPDHPLTRDMARRIPRAVGQADAAEPHAVEAAHGTRDARNARSS